MGHLFVPNKIYATVSNKSGDNAVLSCKTSENKCLNFTVREEKQRKVGSNHMITIAIVEDDKEYRSQYRDYLKQMEAQMLMRHHKGFLE